MPALVYLSLGSNVGDREIQLRDALRRLGDNGRVVAVSSFYETEPVEFTDQAWFLNCVVALETTETPEQLMAVLLGIEQQMGRRRIQKKGPRTIDIDILLFDEAIVDSPALTIPHPAMHQRRFVLEPLAEIAPEVRHPVLKKTVRAPRHCPSQRLTTRGQRPLYGRMIRLPASCGATTAASFSGNWVNRNSTKARALGRPEVRPFASRSRNTSAFSTSESRRLE
jgi:2-amino-4-hydroxy-6-hydroxymethyldihydropteridine diphosphokinase